MRLVFILSAVLLSGCGAGGWVATTYVAGSATFSDPIDPKFELKHLSRDSNPNRWVLHPVTRTKRCMLMHAIEYGNAEQLRELLSNGADPKHCDGGADRLLDALLFRAAVQRIGFVDGTRNLQLDAEFLEVFRERKVRPIDIQRFLSEAARSQSVDGVVYAIKDLGANPNHISDEYGNTPLRCALLPHGQFTERNIEVVDTLIKLGADPDFGLSSDKTALAIARKNYSERTFWPHLEKAMLQKSAIGEGSSNNTVESNARESGARSSP